MDLRKLKSKKGFTLIELMVVIVIIGILVAIALPNFISAQDRAKISSVKANLHTTQTMLETYSVDWSGQYPPNTLQLDTEAKAKKYNKDLKNPFNSSKAYLVTVPERNFVTATTTQNSDGTFSTGTGTTSAPLPAGAARDSGTGYYTPFDPAVTTNASVTNTSTDTLTAYNIYGAAKEGAGTKLFADKNAVFTLTNG